MLNLIKSLPKKIKIIGVAFLAAAFLCLLLIFNLEKGIEFLATKFWAVNLKIENIDLAFNKVKIDKIEIYDKKDRLMIDIPKIDLSYSIFSFELKELNIDSPAIFIVNDSDGINIKEAFKKDKTIEKEKTEDTNVEEIKIEEVTEYEAKSIPVEDININNLLINYKVEKNNKLLEKNLKNINISVKSGRNNGIIAEMKSEENPEKFRILYNNKEEPLYLELKINGLELESYKDFIEADFPKLKKLSGNLEADAIISSKNRAGYIKLNALDVYYSDIESDIKADLEVKLDKEDVDVLIDYEIFGERDQMESMYKDGKLYSLIQIKNIDEAKLSKIVPLRKSKIDLSKIDIADIIFLTQYDIDEGFRINFDLKPNKVEFGAISLDKMRANLIIKDGVKTIENSHIFLKIADMPTKLNLEATIIDNTADMIFQIQNLDKTSNLIPDFKGFIKVKNDTKNINAHIKSNIITFDADYNKEAKELKLYNDKFNLNYNKEAKKLSGNGEVDFSIYGLKNYIKYIIEEDKINFENVKVESEHNKNEKLEAKGYYTLSSGDFKFDYDATDLEIRRLYKEQEIVLSFQGKGEFERYHSVLTGIGDIKGLNLSFLGNFMKSLSGKYSLNLNENNEFEIEFNGKVGELTYGTYKLKDILVRLGFQKDVLNIKKMGNEFFSLTGKINKANQEADLKVSIDNLTNKVIGFDKLDFNIKDVKGEVKGNLENPTVNLDIRNVELYIQDKISKLTGKLSIKDKKVNISNLKLNENKLRGQYDIESKKYNAQIFVDDNLANYMKDKDLDYNLKGLVDIKGIEGQLNSTFNIQGFGKIKNNKLPNLNLNANYSAKNYSDGIVKVNALEAKTSNGLNLVNFKGIINLKNKILNLESNEILDFKDLREYTKNNDIQGKLKLKAILSGKIDEPNYHLTLDSDQISVKNNKITEIYSKLNGDKHSLNVETLSFKYLNNEILGSGNYNIKNKEYNFNLKTSEIVNLSFLNGLLKEKGLKDIAGSADFNLNFKNSGLEGYFKVKDFKLRDEKNYIKVSNFNTVIDLKNNEIKIKEAVASINDGILKLEGDVKIPKDFKNIPDSLIYTLNLDIRDFKYIRPDVANISFNSKIIATNEKIDGDIFINKGTIYDIPNDYKSLSGIISKKILKKKEEAKKTKEEKEKIVQEQKKTKKKIKELSKKWDFVNLRLTTKDPIILDIDDFNIVVGEVKGKLEADLLLEGGKGNYILTGNTEILNGHLYVNTNKFILDRALVSFNDRMTYLPEINPDIFIDSRVVMDEEEINFGVHGRLKKLMYSLSSDNGNSTGSFNSLLLDSKRQISFEGNANDVYLKFMKNIIAGQVAQTVFGPITKNMKNILGLSKLIVKPEVSIYNIDSKIASVNNTGRNSEIYDLGARIEAEKSLYKDSIYLYGTARLFGSTKDHPIQSSLEKNGIKEYDVGIEYRTKDDKIIGVGVGTVPDRYVNQDRNQSKRNYHIDFKIRKKYNSFSEIFSF